MSYAQVKTKPVTVHKGNSTPATRPKMANVLSYTTKFLGTALPAFGGPGLLKDVFKIGAKFGFHRRLDDRSGSLDPGFDGNPPLFRIRFKERRVELVTK